MTDSGDQGRPPSASPAEAVQSVHSSDQDKIDLTPKCKVTRKLLQRISTYLIFPDGGIVWKGRGGEEVSYSGLQGTTWTVDSLNPVGLGNSRLTQGRLDPGLETLAT